jgi:plasmid stabilization system protein ParE
MASVVYSQRALSDIERCFRFLSESNPAAAGKSVRAITSAILGLQRHPLIGRRVDGDLRELIISYGHTGYIALYRFLVHKDEVRILGLRHQREMGYRP